MPRRRLTLPKAHIPLSAEEILKTLETASYNDITPIGISDANTQLVDSDVPDTDFTPESQTSVSLDGDSQSEVEIAAVIMLNALAKETFEAKVSIIEDWRRL